MNDFLNIIQLIQSARTQALSAVNSELVNLYWQVGQYVSIRLEQATWGDGMVPELAQYIQKHHPEIKGFDKVNLYRMCRFYDLYKNHPFVAPVVQQIQSIDNDSETIIAPVVRQLKKADNKKKTIVTPVVPQLQQIDESDLSDIRSTVLAQIS